MSAGLLAIPQSSAAAAAASPALPRAASLPQGMGGGGGADAAAGAHDDKYATPLTAPSADLRIQGKYILGRKLGSGAFGDIYASVNIETNEQFAVKMVCRALMNRS